MGPKVRGLRDGLTGVCLAAFLALLFTQPARAAPPARAAGGGEAVFQQNCSGCHTIGGGRLVGPDLKGVTALRDRDWLVRFIAEPDKVLAEGDPIAAGLLQEYGGVRMPSVGLSSGEVQAVIAYLEAAGSGTPPPAAPAAGDPKRGEALFAGTADLQNRGTPCLGCHSAGKIGLLGGGVVGPDLTQVAERYGTGLEAALAQIAWPVMAPIYSRHPLTPQEQADLVAFLQAQSGRQAADWEWLVIALSLAGLAAALAAIGFVWRHRLLAVRRRMVEQARTR